MSLSDLTGYRGLVFGVANRRSIAWGIAESLARAGADIGLVFQAERLRKGIEGAAAGLGERVGFVAPCDVANEDEVTSVIDLARSTWGGIDFVIHSIAFANPDDLSGEFLSTSREGFTLAHEISAYSLTALARAAAPLLSDRGSIVTMTYLGAQRAIPGYNVMGVAKASLEASVRYLACDLGPRGVRVNAISAGPVKTLAAMGIGGFSLMQRYAAERAPLRRGVTLEEIGSTAVFLVSDAAAAITGSVIHVDGGYHALAP